MIPIQGLNQSSSALLQLKEKPTELQLFEFGCFTSAQICVAQSGTFGGVQTADLLSVRQTPKSIDPVPLLQLSKLT